MGKTAMTIELASPSARAAGKPPSTNGPVIEVHGLHKSFGSQHVLRGIDLEVQLGETMVIIGGSGCGKSVFLRHLVGLHHPDRGTIKVLGQDIAHADEASLNRVRRRISMVFQGSALFNSLTVEENVGLALREHRLYDERTVKNIVLEKLALVNLVEHAKKMPENLSGGMRKRVALARALAIDPDILLYDEPTAELDPFFAQTIDQLVLDLQHDLEKTAIVVTHDMVHAFKIADRIGMLHDGNLVFLGTPEEIRASEDPIIKPFIRREGLGAFGEPPHLADNSNNEGQTPSQKKSIWE
jgi:phospholipid/cholesterol/gamma-HCH transport system ATP-binding protein